MKKGFTLVMAVFFVVLIATIGMTTLSLSTSGAKESTNVYLREQAELFAISAAEIAIMAMQDHNYALNCLNNVTVNDTLLTASVRISYFDNTLPATCNLLSATGNNLLGAGTPDNIAMLDIVVTSNLGVSTEPIRFYKRIIQRP